MQGEAAAAQIIRPRYARPSQTRAHPCVELGALRPPARGDAGLRIACERRPALVKEVAALRQDRQSLAVLLTKRIPRSHHEVAAHHDFVVVEEDYLVGTANRSHSEPHVAYGAIAAKRHALPRVAGSELFDALHDTHRLRIRDNRDIECGVFSGDSAHAPRDLGGRRDWAHDEQGDGRDIAHLLERGEATVKIRSGIVERRRMVVCAGRVRLGMIVCPIRRNHDNRSHATTSLAAHQPPTAACVPRYGVTCRRATAQILARARRATKP